jgi:arachidonate 15-lipoxygenase (second type)/8-lipoxygenase (S-type)
MLTNYTSDLLFSMERLSVNPYSIRRLQPGTALPFTLDASVVQSLTGTTLETLLLTSRLFYADHRAQNALNRTHLVSAACDAYFYISPSSGDFLPLAIRTNVGANLVYTPKDAGNDWFLAKLLFNINDFFFAQLYHFAASHEVVEIVLQAGIRTLSDEHPVLAVLSRSKSCSRLVLFIFPCLDSFSSSSPTSVFYKSVV